MTESITDVARDPNTRAVASAIARIKKENNVDTREAFNYYLTRTGGWVPKNTFRINLFVLERILGK